MRLDQVTKDFTQVLKSSRTKTSQPPWATLPKRSVVPNFLEKHW